MSLGALLLCLVALVSLAGCGTTRWTDTKRTATEQMLVSDAIDRAVSRMDFRILAGKDVFLDTAYLGEAVDKEYLTGALRQQMFSSGCILKEKREQAAFVVEVRGHNRHRPARSAVRHAVDQLADLLGAGCRSTSIPNSLPEMALARRTDQQAMAKIAVFAYHRETGASVWQSGADIVASKARDLWVFGAGPFQKGTIYDHTQFAGDDLHVPLVPEETAPDGAPVPVRVSQQRLFNAPNTFPTKPPPAAITSDPSLQLLAPPFTSDLHPEPANFNQPLARAGVGSDEAAVGERQEKER